MFGLLKRLKSEPEPDRSQLVPRIKNTLFKSSLEGMGIPYEQLPITRPIAADLVVTYAFDMPGMFEMATPLQLRRMGLDPLECRGLALENIGRIISSARIKQHGPVYRIITGQDMEACMILPRKLWENYRPRMTGKLVVSVPSRDVVLFCDGASHKAVRQMGEIAMEAYDEAGNHGLTLELLEWTKLGWRTYEN